MTIPTAVYFGGEIQTGQYGIQYSCNPKFTFPGTENTRFEDVKCTIYEMLGMDVSEGSLKISARYNTSSGQGYHFILFPVNSDVEWKLIFEMAKHEMNWRFIELYVELQSSSSAPYFDSHVAGTSNTFEEPVTEPISDYNMLNENKINFDLNEPINFDLNEPINDIPEGPEDNDNENILPDEEEWATGEDYGYTSDEDNDSDYNPCDIFEPGIVIQRLC